MIDVDAKEFRAFLRVCKKLSSAADLRSSIMLSESKDFMFVGHDTRVHFIIEKQDCYRWCHYTEFIDAWKQAVGKGDKTAHLTFSSNNSIEITASCKKIEVPKCLPQGGCTLFFHKSALYDVIKDIVPKIDDCRGMVYNNLILEPDGPYCAVYGYDYRGRLVGRSTVPLMYGSDWHNVKRIFVPRRVCEVMGHMPSKNVNITVTDKDALGCRLQSGMVFLTWQGYIF